MSNRKLIYSPFDKENKEFSKESPYKINVKHNPIYTRSSMETEKTCNQVKTQNISDSVVNSNKYSNRTPQHVRTPRSVSGIPSAVTPLNHKNYSYPSTPSTTPSRLRCKNSTLLQTPECFNPVIMETPTKTRSSKKNDLVSDEISNLTVAVRIRPMNSKELSTVSVSNIIVVDNNEVTVLAGTTADSSAGVSHSFQYDQVYWSCDPEKPNFADQKILFEGLAKPLIDTAFDGYNACLFAYGQTGSGKTYSMMGIDSGAEDFDVTGIKSEAGIIPRFCHEMFRRINLLDTKITATVEVSYFEIYNEKIHDLLSLNIGNNGHKAPLKVREHPELGPYVVDLSTQAVNSHNDLRKWLAVGNSRRATAATGMNDKSSRSHCIFSVILNLSGPDSNQGIRSKISLVDLAGSERLSHTCASGERLREGVSINKSLLTLGKVIAALAESRKSGVFVPYRESVLTWLLRENLGGNSRTCMLAAVSPAGRHADETLATLRYACQARTIVNRVRVNEDPHERVIRELRKEVERLRALRQDYERRERHSDAAAAAPTTIVIETGSEETPEVDGLRRRLAQTERRLRDAQKSWQERLREAADCQESEMRLLRRRGVALELSGHQHQPCLVNLTADPMLSGTLLYLLPPGTLRVGRSLGPRDERDVRRRPPDIALDSPLVAYEHCTIENVGGHLIMHIDNPEAETFVNGEVVFGSVTLRHCDRVVIGGTHYFRVSNPLDPEFKQDSGKHQRPSQQQGINYLLPDYELAHQEVLKAQEMCLRKELQKEKEKAIAELEEERKLTEMQYQQELQRLGSSLEKAERRRDELESQARIVDQKSTENVDAVKLAPYKSTFLKDLAKILGEDVPETHSLHELHLMVREASQRCKDNGLDIEFKQSHVIGPNGTKPMIILVDRERQLTTQWAPARLECWLNRLRENEIDVQDLLDTDISWHEDFNLNDTKCDPLNTSRVSLNISFVKENLLQQRTENCFEKEASDCLMQIQSQARLLKKLAHEQASRRISGTVTRNVEDMERIVEDLKSLLCPKSNNHRTTKTVRFLLD